MATKTVVFADLDGTLLDDQYKFDKTKPIIDKLSTLGTFIVFCSSKTRSEIEYYRKALDQNEPFIAENGSAIFIPKNYFPFSYACTKSQEYNVIRLGASYETLRNKLAKIRERTAAKIVGFGDLSLKELALDSGLPLNLAKLAKKREHDEPFRILKGNRSSILSAIKSEGLSCSEGGKYFHLTGNTDKGKAVTILKKLYHQMIGDINYVGIGDGPNDLPMLNAVDKPFLIRRKAEDLSLSSNCWYEILRLISARVLFNSSMQHFR